MKSDIERARSVNPMNIMDVAKKIGICEYIIPYGKYKAKISVDDICDKKIKSRLILVTAINPTPMGEGKNTVSYPCKGGMRFANPQKPGNVGADSVP